MNSAFKPTAYNSLSPYFIVKDAKKFIGFLEKLFDGKQLRIYQMPDGSVMHAEVRIDDSVLMLADSSEQYPAFPQMVHLYAKNVDEIYNNAMKLGCKSEHPPVEREGDPDRRCTFHDPFGNSWSVGTQL